jgi:NTE family protein
VSIDKHGHAVNARERVHGVSGVGRDANRDQRPTRPGYSMAPGFVRIGITMVAVEVPGLFPPVVVNGMHYVDGGAVNSIPLSRAIECGATTIFVPHVGHIDDQLEVPTRPRDVGVVAFEIARRHRFASDLASVPYGTVVHVLPTGAPVGKYNDPSKLRYRNLSNAASQITAALEASRAVLERLSANQWKT